MTLACRHQCDGLFLSGHQVQGSSSNLNKTLLFVTKPWWTDRQFGYKLRFLNTSVPESELFWKGSIYSIWCLSWHLYRSCEVWVSQNHFELYVQRDGLSAHPLLPSLKWGMGTILFLCLATTSWVLHMNFLMHTRHFLSPSLCRFVQLTIFQTDLLVLQMSVSSDTG